MTKKMKILAAVDLSEYSAAVVRYTGLLATKMDADVVMINVINQRDIDMIHRTMLGYESFSFPDYMTDQEITRETQMNDLVKANCPDGVNCRCIVVSGIPFREILQTIENEKPQFVVVGTKGRSNLADVIVGSTARQLYRRCPIPLLSIPAGFDKLP